jgi:hypothetical protein
MDLPDAIDLLTMSPVDAVAELPDEQTRRPLASCDPDILCLYERLVIGAEGLRAFYRAQLMDRGGKWAAAAARAMHHMRRVQQEIEELRG